MSQDQSAHAVYADIIDLPRHQPDKRGHMGMRDRAAQFAPFAALVGCGEMVGEAARLTGRQITPGESDPDRLDRIFRCLSVQFGTGHRPEISVLIFVPDRHKSGGCYETVTGRAKRLDPVEKKLILLGKGLPPEEFRLDLDRDIEGITEQGSG